MNKEKSLANYYSRGFALTNKNLEVYLINLVIELPTILHSLFPKLPFSGILALFSYVMILISLGFSLSIPLFLLQKQQNKSLDFQDMLSTTFQNTKRIILPAILVFIILVVLLIVSSILVAISLHPTKEQVLQFFQSWGNLGRGWHPILLILPFTLSFFVFTPFLFALEHKGLFTSIRDGFVMCTRHLPYLVTVMFVGMISYSVISFLPGTEFWGLLLRIAINLYVSLIVAASTLFYYQQNIRSD